MDLLLEATCPPCDCADDPEEGEGSASFGVWLSLFAGSATSLGAVIAWFTGGQNNVKWLANSLAFAAGVMIYISLVEIFHEALEHTEEAGYSKSKAMAITTALFFVGIALTLALERLSHWLESRGALTHGGYDDRDLLDSEERDSELADPYSSGPGSVQGEGSRRGTGAADSKASLTRTGLLTAAALAIHNIPEGIAVMFSTASDRSFGISIALAIAFHNIPEGLAIAVPYHAGRGSRWKTFMLTLGSGLAQPVGALIAYWAMRDNLSPLAFGISFALVGGIMVCISFVALLPLARKHDDSHEFKMTSYSCFAGMAVIALSLVVLEELEL